MDPISNMLITIKNAALVNKEIVFTPFSKQKMAILEILQAKGYIKNFDIDKKSLNIKITLKVEKTGQIFTNIKRISKPGRRIYTKSSTIPYPKNQLGVVIISTPQGVMTGKEAKYKGLGGELICEVL